MPAYSSLIQLFATINFHFFERVGLTWLQESKLFTVFVEFLPTFANSSILRQAFREFFPASGPYSARWQCNQRRGKSNLNFQLDSFLKYVCWSFKGERALLLGVFQSLLSNELEVYQNNGGLRNTIKNLDIRRINNQLIFTRTGSLRAWLEEHKIRWPRSTAKLGRKEVAVVTSHITLWLLATSQIS